MIKALLVFGGCVSLGGFCVWWYLHYCWSEKEPESDKQELGDEWNGWND
jgi:hypothetical protein